MCGSQEIVRQGGVPSPTINSIESVERKPWYTIPHPITHPSSSTNRSEGSLIQPRSPHYLHYPRIALNNKYPHPSSSSFPMHFPIHLPSSQALPHPARNAAVRSHPRRKLHQPPRSLDYLTVFLSPCRLAFPTHTIPTLSHYCCFLGTWHHPISAQRQSQTQTLQPIRTVSSRVRNGVMQCDAVVRV